MIDWLRNDVSPTIELGGRPVPIQVKRHPTARRMVLRLSDDGQNVHVTLPRYGRTCDAVAFVRSRRAWLERRVETTPPSADIWQAGALRYRGQPVSLRWSEQAPRKPVFEDNGLTLGGPREGAERRVQKWLEGEASSSMMRDLAFYCERANVEVATLKLSRARRRWGSCSGKGVIRVNWRLIQAPCEVRRSVVAHEVAHLVHFDHSPAFHRLLGKIYDADLAHANDWLRRHGRSLYAAFG